MTSFYPIRAAGFFPCGLLLCGVTAFGFQPPKTPARELVNSYCVSCHNEKLKTAGLALDRADAEHPANSAESWEKVIVKLRSRAMPPPGVRRPDNGTYDKVSAWLESEIDRAAATHVNPGRSAALHRLNRAEYANAVRDLIAVDVDAQAMLPPDEQAFGFENNAEALSMQPALLERLCKVFVGGVQRRRIQQLRVVGRVEGIATAMNVEDFLGRAVIGSKFIVRYRPGRNS